MADVSACALSGVQVAWGAVAGATVYDLLVDGTTTVAGVTSPYTYSPGNSSSHTYQVRGRSASCTGPYSAGTTGVDANYALSGFAGVHRGRPRRLRRHRGQGTWSPPSSWNDAGGDPLLRGSTERAAHLGSARRRDRPSTTTPAAPTGPPTPTPSSPPTAPAAAPTAARASPRPTRSVRRPTFGGLASAAALSDTCGIRLDWSAATSNCASAPSVIYNVYRSTSSAFSPEAGNRIASCVTGLFYEDTVSVTGGTPYYYVVRAEDSLGRPRRPLQRRVRGDNTTQRSATAGGGGTVTLLSASFDSRLWAYPARLAEVNFGGQRSWIGVMAAPVELHQRASIPAGPRIARAEYRNDNIEQLWPRGRGSCRRYGRPLPGPTTAGSSRHRLRTTGRLRGRLTNTLPTYRLRRRHLPLRPDLQRHGRGADGFQRAVNGIRHRDDALTEVDLSRFCTVQRASRTAAPAALLPSTLTPDGSNRYDGWFIDDISVTHVQPAPPAPPPPTRSSSSPPPRPGAPASRPEQARVVLPAGASQLRDRVLRSDGSFPTGPDRAGRPGSTDAEIVRPHLGYDTGRTAGLTSARPTTTPASSRTAGSTRRSRPSPAGPRTRASRARLGQVGLQHRRDGADAAGAGVAVRGVQRPGAARDGVGGERRHVAASAHGRRCLMYAPAQDRPSVVDRASTGSRPCCSGRRTATVYAVDGHTGASCGTAR